MFPNKNKWYVTARFVVPRDAGRALMHLHLESGENSWLIFRLFSTGFFKLQIRRKDPESAIFVVFLFFHSLFLPREQRTQKKPLVSLVRFVLASAAQIKLWRSHCEMPPHQKKRKKKCKELSSNWAKILMPWGQLTWFMVHEWKSWVSLMGE